MTEQNLTKYYQTKFKDFDMDLTLNPLTNDFAKLSHINSVKKRVKNLVLTQLYDRPYQPSLGHQVTGMLFEFAGTSELQLMEEMLIDLIRAFEPSVDLLHVGVNEFQNGHGIQVNIKFTVIEHEEEAELVLPLMRVR